MGIGTTKLDNVANIEKKLPKNYIKSNGCKVPACKKYISNLIEGESFPIFKNGYPLYAKMKCKLIKKKLSIQSISETSVFLYFINGINEIIYYLNME